MFAFFRRPPGAGVIAGHSRPADRMNGLSDVALFAIILQRAITGSLAGSQGGGTAIAALSRQPQPHAAAALAGAFGTTFWVAVALLAAALVPALLLPRPHREQPGTGPGAQDPITQGTSHGS